MLLLLLLCDARLLLSNDTGWSSDLALCRLEEVWGGGAGGGGAVVGTGAALVGGGGGRGGCGDNDNVGNRNDDPVCEGDPEAFPDVLGRGDDLFFPVLSLVAGRTCIESLSEGRERFTSSEADARVVGPINPL